MLSSLCRPEYLYRPSQIWRRLCQPWSPYLPPVATRTMPWGWPLRIRTQETIGRLIWTFGLFDLTVSEVLWRLTEDGEVAVDAGANIGCMSCLLAARVGPRGRVLAFEPFPEVHAELAGNLAAWRVVEPQVQVQLFTCALGARPGQGTLDAPDPAQQNRGLARVETGTITSGPVVEVRTLDAVMGPDERVGVMKIDVEGGELGVLQGADQLLRSGRVRDVVFEDHADYPSEVTRYLAERGYELFSLRRRLGGVVIRPAGEPTLPLDPMDSPSYIATRDSRRLRERLGTVGWQVLKGRRART